MEKVRNYKWDSNVANRFKIAVIRNLKVSDNLTNNITDISQSSSALATNLNDFFYQCASDANMKVKCASGRSYKPKISKHKKWLTPNLSSMKAQLLSLAKKLRATPYDTSKHSSFHSSKKMNKKW